MQEQNAGGGGAANTPPFPRPEREPEAPAASEDSRSEAPAPHPAESAHTGGPGDGASPPEPSRTAPEPTEGSRPGVARDTPLDFDSGLDVGGSGDAPPYVSPIAEEVRRRPDTGLHRGFARIADSLDEAAEHLGRLADDHLEGGGRPGSAARSTAGWMEGAADYLRSADLRSMQEDLERQVRDKPFQTLLLAAGTGWLLGKIMR
jgi:ElaB/YqjD/DUF883 family membrane-anchored ribosome-binding protein